MRTDKDALAEARSEQLVAAGEYRQAREKLEAALAKVAKLAKPVAEAYDKKRDQ